MSKPETIEEGVLDKNYQRRMKQLNSPKTMDQKKYPSAITVDVAMFTDEALIIIWHMMACSHGLGFVLDLDDSTTPFYLATKAEAVRRKLVVNTRSRVKGLPNGTRITPKGKRAFERADNL